MMTPFLETRWNGQAALETVFWRDMLLVGTLVNLAAAGAAFALLAAGAPVWLGLAALFAPLPWNIFLFAAVWRAAERQESPLARTAKAAGVIWFLAMVAL